MLQTDLLIYLSEGIVAAATYFPVVAWLIILARFVWIPYEEQWHYIKASARNALLAYAAILLMWIIVYFIPDWYK